jgi:hypothetical protein
LPWGEGAGHVTPNAAANPGLVYDLTATDYKKYMCGAGMSDCSQGSLPGYNLNLPSITVGNVLGTQAVTRKVTNVGTASATYSGTISVPGYSATLEPASFTVAPGASQSFTVRLTRNGAPANVWQFGTLIWRDGSHTVRSPVQARSGAPITAPALFSSEKVAGSKTLGLGTGFEGYLKAAQGGLKEVARSALTVSEAPAGSVDSLALVTAACLAGGSGVRVLPYTFPANTVAARFETFDRDTSGGGGHDLDLAVLYGNTLVGYSGNGGSNEAVTLASPPAGAYKVCVVGYAAANGVATDFTLSAAVVNRSDTGGNMKVAIPAYVYSAGTASAGVSWSGLATGKRYLGGVQFLDASGATAATTLVNIETNNPIPLTAAVQRTVRPVGDK